MGFFLITVLVTRGVFLQIDRYIDQNLPYVAWLYYIAKAVDYLYLPVVVIMFVLIWHFWQKKQKFETFMLFLTFAAFVIPELIIKPVSQVPCPPSFYAGVLASKGLFQYPLFQKIALLETCYPSTHTTSYVVFFGYFIYLSLRYIKKLMLRRLIIAIFIMMIVLVGPAMVYVHGHWLSDVIAGYFLGFALLNFVLWLRIKA
ncbi:phosphatase PAP2 family protein [Candidatus Daviesbacteria bacterium]|nr:phosphatase PAP2 family protein [Candidatus Daviesbacteria bacterium]